jgi:hypothetical protein
MRFLLPIKPSNSVLERHKELAVQEGLFLKTDFHITVIGRAIGDDIASRLGTLSTETKVELTESIEALKKEYEWSYETIAEYYFITKQYEEGEVRRSIIQTVVIPELESFYTKLNQLLKTSFLTPFPHVTLYTISTNPDNRARGIGIDSQEQFFLLNPKKIII